MQYCTQLSGPAKIKLKKLKLKKSWKLLEKKIKKKIYSLESKPNITKLSQIHVVKSQNIAYRSIIAGSCKNNSPKKIPQKTRYYEPSQTNK